MQEVLDIVFSDQFLKFQTFIVAAQKPNKRLFSNNYFRSAKP